MAQRAGDLLVTLLNIDAEIRDRMERLAQLDHSAEECTAPWLGEARIALRTDLTLLRSHREECFRRLNDRVRAIRLTGRLHGLIGRAEGTHSRDSAAAWIW